MKVTTLYRCEQCGEEDKDNGNNLPAPRVLNCAICKGKESMHPYEERER